MFARAVRDLKEIKGLQILKDNVRVSLFADDMTLCTSDPKNSCGKLL